MKKMERPEIELYLYSMNQEFPVDKGHSTFLERHSQVKQDVTGEKLVAMEEVAAHTYQERGRGMAADWSLKWIHNKWIQNYTKTPSWSSGLAAKDLDLLAHLIMRKEDFGGIVLDPTFDRVYKVNKPGYALLAEIIKSSESIRKNGKFRSRKFREADIEHFVYFLNGAGLWPA